MKSGWVGELLEFLAGLLTAKEIRAQGAEPIPGAVVTVPIAVTGYAAPRPPAGAVESRLITDCTQYLQDRLPLVQADFQAETGRQLFITRTWSSPEVQFEHFKKGRHLSADGMTWVPNDPARKTGIVTNCDGYKVKSRHNYFPAQAFDVCVDIDPGPGKVASWRNADYAALGPICARHGLVWGGDWNGNGLPDEKFVDAPHIEQPAGTA